MNVSESCYQSISNNCTGNPLSYTSYWTGRDGQMRTYWHGNGSISQNGCYCSIEGDGCLEDRFGIARECNCDSTYEFVEDSGVLRK